MFCYVQLGLHLKLHLLVYSFGSFLLFHAVTPILWRRNVHSEKSFNDKFSGPWRIHTSTTKWWNGTLLRFLTSDFIKCTLHLLCITSVTLLMIRVKSRAPIVHNSACMSEHWMCELPNAHHITVVYRFNCYLLRWVNNNVCTYFYEYSWHLSCSLKFLFVLFSMTANKYLKLFSYRNDEWFWVWPGKWQT